MQEPVDLALGGVVGHQPEVVAAAVADGPVGAQAAQRSLLLGPPAVELDVTAPHGRPQRLGQRGRRGEIAGGGPLPDGVDDLAEEVLPGVAVEGDVLLVEEDRGGVVGADRHRPAGNGDRPHHLEQGGDGQRVDADGAVDLAPAGQRLDRFEGVGGGREVGGHGDVLQFGRDLPLPVGLGVDRGQHLGGGGVVDRLVEPGHPGHGGEVELPAGGRDLPDVADQPAAAPVLGWGDDGHEPAAGAVAAEHRAGQVEDVGGGADVPAGLGHPGVEVVDGPGQRGQQPRRRRRPDTGGGPVEGPPGRAQGGVRPPDGGQVDGAVLDPQPLEVELRRRGRGGAGQLLPGRAEGPGRVQLLAHDRDGQRRPDPPVAEIVAGPSEGVGGDVETLGRPLDVAAAGGPQPVLPGVDALADIAVGPDRGQGGGAAEDQDRTGQEAGRDPNPPPGRAPRPAEPRDDEQTGHGGGHRGAGAVRPVEVEAEEDLGQAGTDHGADHAAAPAEQDHAQRHPGGHEGQPVVGRPRAGDDRGGRGEEPRLAPGPGRRRRHRRRQRRPQHGVDDPQRRRGAIRGHRPGGGRQAEDGDGDRAPGQHQAGPAGEDGAGDGEGDRGDHDPDEEVHRRSR